MRPIPSTYSDHLSHYVNIVEGDDFLHALKTQSNQMENLLYSISDEKSNFKYGEDKWTIKEVILHLADAERVFAYRALAIARGEKNALPNFDENSYAVFSHANERKWSDLIDEFFATRKSSEALLQSFSEIDLNQTGTASGSPISVLALCFIIVGHAAHHVNILRDRYLVG
jgi:uncharacterized damage-inducible protein DinB